MKRACHTKKGLSRDIQRNASQRFIHRRIGRAIAPDAGLVAKRLRNRLTDRDGAVLGRVVLIDMQVARDPTRDVDQRMARELFDHVIEKADPGRDVISAGAIEVHFDDDVGLIESCGRYVRCAWLAYKRPYTGINRVGKA